MNSGYWREEFYLKRVSLDGDLDPDVTVVRILHDENLVGFWSYKREVDSLAVCG